MKMIVAAFLAVATLFSLVACKTNTNDGKTWLDEYLCIQHEYGVGVVEREATCLREGRIKYACTKCGGGEKVETLAKKEHIPYTVKAKEATCGEIGYNEHEACAVCSTVLTQKQIMPKTSCLQINDFYIGKGECLCHTCGKSYKYYTEKVVTKDNFTFKYWIRCYLPQEDSRGVITLTPKDPQADFGAIITPVGDLAIKSISFEFSYGNDIYSSNAFVTTDDGEKFSVMIKDFNVAGSHDYDEIAIIVNEEVFEGSTVDEYDLYYEISLFEKDFDVEIALENNAKLVFLIGADIDSVPKGSI